jgi:transposase
VSDQEVRLTVAQHRRLKTIEAALERRLTNRQAADALALSVRQVQRLKGKVQRDGPAGIRHGNTGRTPWNRLDDDLREQILHLAATTYADYNFSHLADVLPVEQHISVSDETLRRLLRPAGLGRAMRRRKVHRRRRQRRQREGELLFLDGSPHRWFGPDHPMVCLLLASDDATGKPLYGRFQPQEDRDGCFAVCDRLFRAHGLPAAFYLDRASHFIRTDHRAAKDGRLVPPTAFQIAMHTLAVRVIFANSPQARGRAERLNGTFQDRLVAELVRYRIHTSQRATRYLNERFIPRYAKRFACPPADPTPAWRDLHPQLDLAGVLCVKSTRVIANDNTVRYGGLTYQLEPPRGRRHLVKATIEVQQRFDKTIHFVHPRYGSLKAKPISRRKELNLL